MGKGEPSACNNHCKAIKRIRPIPQGPLWRENDREPRVVRLIADRNPTGWWRRRARRSDAKATIAVPGIAFGRLGPDIAPSTVRPSGRRRLAS